MTIQPTEQLITSCYPLKIRFTLLWHYSWFFWSIQLQLVEFHGECHRRMQYSEERSNFFFVITDLNPSEKKNCIYYTLRYICNQTSKSKVEISSVRFAGIIGEANLRIVCRLGQFHMIMTTFLGSIWNMMKGSG